MDIEQRISESVEDALKSLYHITLEKSLIQLQNTGKILKVMLRWLFFRF